MTTAGKFPSALLALTDLFGELPNFPPLTLNGSINASVTSIVVNEAIPATWPTLSWITVDSEIMRVTSYNAGTKTFTVAARDASAGNAQSTTAATHASGAYLFVALTAQQWNQVVADLIAVETQALVGPSTNQVLNSDFSRRTVFGLAMPEVFADTSGYVKVDAGASPTVGSNILTFGAASNELAWCNQSFVWRDGRMSATFKAVLAAGQYELRWRIDSINFIGAYYDGTNLNLRKDVAGVITTPATVAQALTLNRWYWLEIEKQGTTIIVKIYDTGGTVPGVLKSASTLLQTLTATVADAGLQIGAHPHITSNQAAAQWGGIATGNGGVYVETWLPESWQFTFSDGTQGGCAVGFDESADSGPTEKQWAMRAYIPAASRLIRVKQTTADGSVRASVAYSYSNYHKVSGLGGSGALVRTYYQRQNSAAASQGSTVLDDAGETSWTRKTTVVTNEAGTRRALIGYDINPNTTATGTAYFMLPQLEQGSAVTSWRAAPADDAPIEFYTTVLNKDITTTSAVFVDLDSRDAAGNFFLPRDATIDIFWYGQVVNSGANSERVGVSVDGVDTGVLGNYAGGTTSGQVFAQHRTTLAAGKHRIAARWLATAGTGTFSGATVANGLFRVTAYVGK